MRILPFASDCDIFYVIIGLGRRISFFLSLAPLWVRDLVPLGAAVCVGHARGRARARTHTHTHTHAHTHTHTLLSLHNNLFVIIIIIIINVYIVNKKKTNFFISSHCFKMYVKNTHTHTHTLTNLFVLIKNFIF